MFGKKTRQTGTPAPAPARPAPPSGATPPSAPAVPPAAARTGKGVGKLAYETRRAEKNGMGLENWMAEKDRRARAERDAIAEARRKSGSGRPAETAKPGLLRRLLDRAHKPL